MAEKRPKRATTKSKSVRDRTTAAKSDAAQGGIVQGLERRIRRLEGELVTERMRHERQLDNVRRAANRRLAAMMQEITALRHHEARADALARLVAERDAALAALTSEPKRTTDGQDPGLPG